MRYPLDAPTMFKAANRTHYERTVLLMLNGWSGSVLVRQASLFLLPFISIRRIGALRRRKS